MVRVASVNVNGIRAAFRKGMADWLDASDADVVTLQEVRAETSDVEALIDRGWTILHDSCSQKGRAGVAILSRFPVSASRNILGPDSVDTSGRWLEGDVTLPSGPTLTVVSAYVHSGEVDTPKQDAKYEFLDHMDARMKELGSGNSLALVTGDLNVGHRTLDIKNWKGNVKNSGFLPEEREYFDRWLGAESDEDYNTGSKVASSTWGASGLAKLRGPIRGGATAGKHSTPTPGGGSTTTSRPRPSPKPCATIELTVLPPMTPVGQTTPRSWPTTPSSRLALAR